MYQRRWKRQVADSLQIPRKHTVRPATLSTRDSDLTFEVCRTEPAIHLSFINDAIKDTEQARCAMHAAKECAH
jgi:hypothetical protein